MPKPSEHFRLDPKTWDADKEFFKTVEKFLIETYAPKPENEQPPMLIFTTTDKTTTLVAVPHYPEARVVYRHVMRDLLLEHKAISYAFIGTANMRKADSIEELQEVDKIPIVTEVLTMVGATRPNPMLQEGLTFSKIWRMKRHIMGVNLVIDSDIMGFNYTPSPLNFLMSPTANMEDYV